MLTLVKQLPTGDQLFCRYLYRNDRGNYFIISNGGGRAWLIYTACGATEYFMPIYGQLACLTRFSSLEEAANASL